MTGYTVVLFLFILLHSNEEERIAVLVRKKETGEAAEGCKEGKRTQWRRPNSWNHLNLREINFWNANVGVDGLRGILSSLCCGALVRTSPRRDAATHMQS